MYCTYVTIIKIIDVFNRYNKKIVLWIFMINDQDNIKLNTDNNF